MKWKEFCFRYIANPPSRALPKTSARDCTPSWEAPCCLWEATQGEVRLTGLCRHYFMDPWILSVPVLWPSTEQCRQTKLLQCLPKEQQRRKSKVRKKANHKGCAKQNWNVIKTSFLYVRRVRQNLVSSRQLPSIVLVPRLWHKNDNKWSKIQGATNLMKTVTSCKPLLCSSPFLCTSEKHSTSSSYSYYGPHRNFQIMISYTCW